MKKFFILFALILIQGCSSGGDSSNVDTNSSPIADAGNDQTVLVGIAVSLIGSNSTDADSDQLTYFWSFESKPANSTSIIFDENTAFASFTPDIEGEYIVQLSVNDGLASGLDTMMVAATRPSGASVATLYFINDFAGEIISIIGACSSGICDTYLTITSTDPNDTTPNIIEQADFGSTAVGFTVLPECDVLWKIEPVIKDKSPSADDNDMIAATLDMQLFSCGESYTCRLSNLRPFVTGTIADIECTLNL